MYSTFGDQVRDYQFTLDRMRMRALLGGVNVKKCRILQVDGIEQTTCLVKNAGLVKMQMPLVHAQ